MRKSLSRSLAGVEPASLSPGGKVCNPIGFGDLARVYTMEEFSLLGPTASFGLNNSFVPSLHPDCSSRHQNVCWFWFQGRQVLPGLCEGPLLKVHCWAEGKVSSAFQKILFLGRLQAWKMSAWEVKHRENYKQWSTRRYNKSFTVDSSLPSCITHFKGSSL